MQQDRRRHFREAESARAAQHQATSGAAAPLSREEEAAAPFAAETALDRRVLELYRALGAGPVEVRGRSLPAVPLRKVGDGRYLFGTLLLTLALQGPSGDVLVLPDTVALSSVFQKTRCVEAQKLFALNAARGIIVS